MLDGLFRGGRNESDGATITFNDPLLLASRNFRAYESEMGEIETLGH